MRVRPIGLLGLVLLLSSVFVNAVPVTPVVNNNTINYNLNPNQITITVSGFKPSSTAPTVLFNNITLTPLVLFTNPQIDSRR
jgi:hypothetical protein